MLIEDKNGCAELTAAQKRTIRQALKQYSDSYRRTAHHTAGDTRRILAKAEAADAILNLISDISI